MNTWGSFDNQTYLDGIRSQDDAVIKDIYLQIRPEVISQLRRNQIPEEEAEDIFSDALFAVYKQVMAGQLNLTSPFAAYLLGVCQNLYLKWYNRNKIKERVTNQAAVVYEGEVPLADELMEKAVVKQRIQKLFLKMSKSCRQIIQLFWEGNSHQEIMNLMGFGSEGYARQRKHKCQKKLEALMENDPILKEIFNP